MKRLELALDLLRSQTTLALATTAADGSPRTAPLFYLVEDGPRLYWFSSRASEHSRNLKRNPAAAVTVYRAAETWREIRGIQMRGAVSAVTDRARRRSVTKAYTQRFHLGGLFAAAIARSGLYVFEPAWLRYIDNTRRFGYKFEMAKTKPNETERAPFRTL